MQDVHFPRPGFRDSLLSFLHRYTVLLFVFSAFYQNIERKFYSMPVLMTCLLPVKSEVYSQLPHNPVSSALFLYDLQYVFSPEQFPPSGNRQAPQKTKFSIPDAVFFLSIAASPLPPDPAASDTFPLPAYSACSTSAAIS